MLIYGARELKPEAPGASLNGESLVGSLTARPGPANPSYEVGMCPGLPPKRWWTETLLACIWSIHEWVPMGAQNGYTFGFGLAIYVEHPCLMILLHYSTSFIMIIHLWSIDNPLEIMVIPHENHPFPISFMMNELEAWPHNVTSFFHDACEESSIIILIHGRLNVFCVATFRIWNRVKKTRVQPDIHRSSLFLFIRVMLHLSLYIYIEIWSDWFQERFKPKSPIYFIIFHAKILMFPTSFMIFMIKSWENHGTSHGFIWFPMENPMVSRFGSYLGRQEVDVRWEQTGRQITETCYERRGWTYKKATLWWTNIAMEHGHL